MASLTGKSLDWAIHVAAGAGFLLFGYGGFHYCCFFFKKKYKEKKNKYTSC
jgi:hypothetical protein